MVHPGKVVKRVAVYREHYVDVTEALLTMQ